MKVHGKHYRSIWWDGGRVAMIEQNLLPFEFKIIYCNTYQETCEAIRLMTVRGAGAIGAAAAFAMAQAAADAPKAERQTFLNQAKQCIEATRPTARDLFHACQQVYEAALISSAHALEKALFIADKNAADGENIGTHGAALIPDKCNILTHCNAGWLGLVDYGSALAPIYKAAERGSEIFVFVDETRPRSQGARLTAWELSQQNIAHAVIPDNAAAYFLAKGEIDMVIVGADRIAANGDTANKIGTLEKAIAAKYFNIPFYVAAPTSTIDLSCPSGEDIPIELRTPDEVIWQKGITDEGALHSIKTVNPGSDALNPAFDITPSSLITKIITENTCVTASKEGIAKLFD